MKFDRNLGRFCFLIIISVLSITGSYCSRLETMPTLVPPKTLPPTWTPLPASRTVEPPAQTLTPTPTLPPTLTPYPDGYLDSTWLIDIESPTGWYSADHLVTLSDNTIMAAGKVYSNQNKFESWRQTTVWVSRLTPTGDLLWIKYFPISADDQFFSSTLHAGLNKSGLLSGAYYHPTGDGRVNTYRVTISISSEGNIEWILPISSGFKEVLGDGSILLQTGIKTSSIYNQQGELVFQTELDFGPDFGEEMVYPYPDLDIAHQLPDSDWLFAGTIAGEYWGESSPARSGYMEGDTAYWYARFSADGKLKWKHLHPIDPLRQNIRGLTITAENQIVVSGADQHQPYSYSWLRKVDAEGKTVFHIRYLDLPILWETISPGFDGSIFFWGRRTIPQGEYQPDLKIVSLAKVSQAGDLEWIRTFPNHVYINAALPLNDGSILLSLRVPAGAITLARVDASGQLPDCTDLPLESFESRVDQQPPLFDIADQVPISLSLTTPDAEEAIDLPEITLKSINLPLTELCRDLSEQ